VTQPKVTIIGAGIVGVCSALWLQRAGFQVELVDAGGVGRGASSGNAGNISPGAVVPYTIPGVLRQAPRWLLDPEGPLVVRPGYFPRVAPWLMKLARSSSTEAALKTSRAMRLLHGTTFEAYEELTRGTPAAALIERCGQLYVSERPDAAQGSMLSQVMREAAGVKTVLLGEGEIREVEPALAPIFKSGMLLPLNGRTRDPYRLVRLLADEAQRHGATVVRGKASSFRIEDRRVHAVMVDGQARPVERLLIAAGAASDRLTAMLGTMLPLEAERGYHITIGRPGVLPRIPVTHVDAKFAAAPMDVGLRLAGTVEYAGIDAAPNWKRTTLLEKQAQRMFPRAGAVEVTRWAGDRPTLPDGLPVLGVAPRFDNAWFAFGNSHFGMTAGPVMGRVAAQLVAGNPPDIDIEPFAPTRFNHR
jgi:D-amino-acid dehydrogenase